MDKSETLEHYFGYKSFREGQEQIIDRLLSGGDAVGIMPTGAGKSICYQVPALMMDGITLVISPLISLMKDQVGALVQSGVSAAFINSTLTPRQSDIALYRAANGIYKIIYVAPERLAAPSFLDFALNADISMVVVDEAHCVSQWGQNFRPSYLKIAEFISLLKKRPTAAAFTATAVGRFFSRLMNSAILR
jgi:ATP-dependent DNA helicase RecQ